MKVLHCCLAAFYIDDFGYQENILPRIHRKQGHTVEIVASTETYIERVRLGYVQPGSYISSDGIPVTRLPYVTWLPAPLARKLRLYQGLQQLIERFAPDVLFLHDCQFMDVGIVARYARRHGTTVYVDSHTDWVNSGRNWISRHILHGLLYRACVRQVAPVVRRFYPTLPARAKFLHEVYGVPLQQMQLLPFGADDSTIDHSQRDAVRSSVRHSLGLRDDQLVFVTGGKIDRRKNIHLLIQAFMNGAADRSLGDAVLVVFGKPDAELQEEVAAAQAHPAVRYVGWVAAPEVHRYLWAADVALFPGTHSVLWEEAVGLGVACVFKRWDGIEHVDLGGNCLMLDENSVPVLTAVMVRLAQDAPLRQRLRQVASTQGVKAFSYTEIARRALEPEGIILAHVQEPEVAHRAGSAASPEELTAAPVTDARGH